MNSRTAEGSKVLLSALSEVIGWDEDGSPIYDISEGPADWSVPAVPDDACIVHKQDALQLLPDASQRTIYLFINPIDAQTLREVTRVLKPKGKIIVMKDSSTPKEK